MDRLTEKAPALLDRIGPIGRRAVDAGAGDEYASAVAAEGAKQGLAKAAKHLHARIRRDGVLALPTVSISPPPIAALEADIEAWKAANSATLRNTRLANFLNCCALTLPCGRDRNGVPVGLMLMAPPRTSRNSGLLWGSRAKSAAFESFSLSYNRILPETIRPGFGTIRITA